MELYELTACQASEYLAKKEISSVELTRSVLERTGQTDGVVQAYLAVLADDALAQAAQADRDGDRAMTTLSPGCPCWVCRLRSRM